MDQFTFRSFYIGGKNEESYGLIIGIESFSYIALDLFKYFIGKFLKVSLTKTFGVRDSYEIFSIEV